MPEVDNKPTIDIEELSKKEASETSFAELVSGTNV
jgi:hypothetical protein